MGYSRVFQNFPEKCSKYISKFFKALSFENSGIPEMLIYFIVCEGCRGWEYPGEQVWRLQVETTAQMEALASLPGTATALLTPDLALKLNPIVILPKVRGKK